MAYKLGTLTFDDLRGGRNGVDQPMTLPENQCVEALNIDFYDARLGRKRKGAIAYTPAPVGFAGPILTLIRHTPLGKETDHQLWGIDSLRNVLRLVNNVWSSLGKLPDIVTTDNDPGRIHWASFNNKLFFAYGSGAGNNTDRMHVFDPSTGTIRKAGLAAMTIPTWVPATGTAFTERRFYRTAATQKINNVVVRRSDVSPTLTAAMVNGGGWVVTRGTPPGEGETHWELYTAKGNTPTGPTQIGAWYVIADLPLATSTFTDKVQYANFPPPDALLAPQTGANAPLPSSKYLLVDEARLLLAGWWPTPTGGFGYDSRVWWTPILFDASQVANDEHINLYLNPYIDFDPGDGGEITGLGGPLFDCPYVFKYNRIYKMVRTGLPDAPYRPVTVSKACGCIHQRTIVRGEDENGAECLYFLSKRGPYRLGVNGLQYLGRDIEDLWRLVQLDRINGAPYTGLPGFNCSAHGIYIQELHQVWWYVPTTLNMGCPDRKIVFDVRLGRTIDSDGVRGGWVQHIGASCEAYASATFSQKWDATQLTNSPAVKPFIAQSGNDFSSPITRYDERGDPPPLPAPVPQAVGDPRIWQVDADHTYIDVLDYYAAAVIGRAVALAGSPTIHGGVIEGHVIGCGIEGDCFATFTLGNDFGIIWRGATNTKIPRAGSNTSGLGTSSIVPLRDLAVVSAAVIQFSYGVGGQAVGCEMDALILRIRKEEDR